MCRKKCICNTPFINGCRVHTVQNYLPLIILSHQTKAKSGKKEKLYLLSSVFCPFSLGVFLFLFPSWVTTSQTLILFDLSCLCMHERYTNGIGRLTTKQNTGIQISIINNTHTHISMECVILWIHISDSHTNQSIASYGSEKIQQNL